MRINFDEGTNFSSAPSWLTGSGGVLDQIQRFYDHLFTNSITIDIRLNWVGLPWTQTSTHEGGVLANNSLTSGSHGVTSSYSTVSGALISHGGNAIQGEAYGNMPTSGVSSVYVAPAEAMVLGLESKQTVFINLNVNSSANWLGSAGFSPLDAFGAIAHEITETAMGRISNPSSTPDVMDMFRFNGSGHHDLISGTSSTNTTAYFSIDDGATNLGTWPNNSGHGDYGDWAQGAGPVGNDAYGTTGGGVAPISEVDIELMNVLGWGVAAVTSGVTSKVSAGHTFTGYTVMSGGLFDVLSGGTASNTTYTDVNAFDDGVLAPSSSATGAGAFGFIQSGGTEISATADGGGFEWVDSGGFASATRVKAYGGIIDFGEVQSATVSAHGTIDIEFGGSAFNTSVMSGGLVSVHSSGSGGNTSVFSGGTLSVAAGGTDSVDRIENGGKDLVFGLTVLDVVSSGGTEIIEAGGSAGLDAVDAGGTQTVAHGGVSDVTFVYGTQDVFGVGSGDIVSGAPANQYVEGGGSAVSAVLSAFGYQYVSSGGYASATIVSDTTDQWVESAGSARSTVVLSGGSAILESGAIGDGLTVSAGGTLDGPGVLINSTTAAGTVDGVTVGDATHVDTLELLSGGVASNVTVTIFADRLLVDAGASATDTVLTSDGSDVVSGTATGTVVSASGVENVASGGSTISAKVLNGGTENLAAGATGEALTVSFGGVLNGPGVLIDSSTVAGTVRGVTVGDATHTDTLELLSGGVASNVTVTIFADSLLVDEGATATGTVVTSDGFDDVYGSATDTVVSASGVENVSSGGLSISATVLNGGTENLASGATGESLTVSFGGRLNGPGVLIDANTVAGTVSGVTVGDGSHADSLVLLSGGVADNVTATFAGDYLKVNSGASATGAVVMSQGFDVVFGSTINTTVSSGGMENVSSGGVASSTQVSGGGGQIVLSSGTARATQVSSGGSQTVLAGGVASGTTVRSGADELLYAGGKAHGVTISSGGLLTLVDAVISSGGARSAGLKSATVTLSGVAMLSGSVLDLLDATVLSGGHDDVGASGVADGTVLRGGSEFVTAGGSASSSLVSSGGLQSVEALGVASGTVVSGGGQMVVSSGGTARQAAILGGGLGIVSGVASSAIVSKLGILRVASGGVASVTTVEAGGFQSVVAGGVARGTVLSGGTENDFGVTVGTLVHSGSKEVVEALGVASGAVIGSGGQLVVSSGGIARGATILHGGQAFASSGGVVSAAVVSSGSMLTVSSGGVVKVATISSGGTLTVASGGAVSGGLNLHGGVAVISGTMAAGQSATFVGTSGTLDLDNLPGFAAKISGLVDPSNKIDLGGFAFSAGESVAWTQAGTSGTLTVTDGAKSAHLSLIGTYTSSSFHLSDDGHGGTLVADPPPAAVQPSAIGFAQAAAGFSMRNAAISAPMSAGRTSGFAEMLHAIGSAGGRA